MNYVDYQSLKSFLSAYFHEDWTCEAPDPDGVVENYLSSGPSERERKSIASDIERYLNIAVGNADAERALFIDLGCYYVPSADGLTVHEWLKHLANRLAG